MTDVWSAPAHQMVDALAAGDVTSELLVGQCLARISAVNPALNAIVVNDGEAATEQAREVDAARARGEALGPLAGLPYTAKLDYDVAGQATSQGSVLHKDAVAVGDAPIIRRMRRAGAILIGRTNEPDFGVSYHTESSLHGPTLNPWDHDRSPGGSSGGEAVAVASGMTPLGLGSDFGGSIRTPASFNGVAGFKPSRGRYPDHVEAFPEPGIHEQLFTQRGPIARSVQDLLLADSVLRGIDPLDPWTTPTLDGTSFPGRVGVVHSPTDSEIPDAIRSAVDAAAEALRATGHQVEEVALGAWEELAGTYAAIALADFGGDPSIWQVFPESTRLFLEHVHAVLEQNAGRPEADLGAAQLARRHRLAVEYNARHADYDLLLMPTWCQPPFASRMMESAEGIDATLIASRHLCIFNLLGLPSLTVPAAVVDGMPIGVHLSALQHRDETVLRAGIDIESQIGRFTPVTPS